MVNHKIISLVLLGVLVAGLLAINNFGQVVTGQTDTGGGEIVGTLESVVCCEKTNSGMFCQDVPASDCASDRQPPTSCDETRFCKVGWCFDSKEGTCLNSPQITCDEDGGTWTENKPAVCELGCCTLDDQASFVSLTRCKALSGYAGIETNWDPSITDEVQCILAAGSKEKGACVYDEDFTRTCKFTTRENCNENVLGGGVLGTQEQDLTGTGEGTPDLLPNADGGAQPSADTDTDTTDGTDTGTTAVAFLPVVSAQDSGERPLPAGCQVSAQGVFFCPGKLCTAEELETNCAQTRNTICKDGKEEVYYVDTCGNPANIYDSNKVNDDAYWANIVNKEDSCGAGTSNENSQSCGNCNYLQGSYCREASEIQPVYGDNICQSLNCVGSDGRGRLHGESWCVYDGGSNGAPGSRAYRQLCVNGEVRVEACADFRQEKCIEDSSGGISQAACRVNRWQDCTAQSEQPECENSDKRDCKWLEGIENIFLGSILNGTSVDTNSLGGIRERAQQQGGLDSLPTGGCVPEIPPGLDFESDESVGICAQANAVCPVTFKKGLLSDWECSEHCECLPGGEAEQQRINLCTSVADCGPKTNFVGQRGSGPGYETTQDELENDK